MSFRYLCLFMWFSLFLVVFSCQKDKDDKREYPKVETSIVKGITEKGALFSANITARSKEPLVDHGFVWSQNQSSLNLEKGERISLGEYSGEGYYEAEIDFALEDQKEYFVKAYAKTKKITVYGEVVSFSSLGSDAPVLLDFEPKIAARGDTITVTGQKLSLADGNTFYFGSERARVVSVNKDLNQADVLVKVIAPLSLNFSDYDIYVEVSGNRSNVLKSFRVASPTISNVVHRTVTWGEALTIYGKNLRGSSLLIDIEGKKTGVVNGWLDSICFTVPYTANCGSTNATLLINGKGGIDSQGQEVPLNFGFELACPIISGFKPTNATWGETVTLYGSFHPLQSASKVYFDNTLAPITSYSSDSIKITVPTTLLSPNATGNVKLIYKANDTEVKASEDFLLEGPVITSFSPDKGFFGDEVNINGSFATGITKLYFGDTEVSSTSITRHNIKITLPSTISGKVSIRVKVGEQQAQAQEEFEAANPRINDFYPKTAALGDEITITGEYLDINPTETIVRFTRQEDFWYNGNWGAVARVNSISSSSIKVTIPGGIGYWDNRISLQVGNLYYLLNGNFDLLPPVITSFSPAEGGPNDEITIYGRNFACYPYQNYVSFGDIKAEVVSNESNKIVVRAPNLSRGSHQISVRWGNIVGVSAHSYNCFSPWKLIKSNDEPRVYKAPGFTFVYKNLAYIYQAEIWSYKYSTNGNTLNSFDPNKNRFETYAMPKISETSLFYNTTNISFQDRIVCVSGKEFKSYQSSESKKVFSYNIETRTWVELNEFPGSAREFGFSFSFTDRAFIGGGSKENFWEDNSLSDFWEYNPIDDIWKQRGNIPFETKYGCFNSDVVNGKGYIVLSNGEVWEYNPNSDEWQRKADFPGQKRFFASSFVINNVLYYGTGRYLLEDLYQGSINDLWAYNVEANEWVSKMAPPTDDRSESTGFTINSKGYWGLGRNTTGYNFYGITDFYEYDPTLEP